MKITFPVLAILVGFSAAVPTAESVVERGTSVSRYDCEYYNNPTLGAIAERRCGGPFGVSPDFVTLL
jgi:hypothetical protein